MPPVDPYDPLFFHHANGPGSLPIQEKPNTVGNSSDQWDTCNNMVISWLMTFVNESIAKSIMFVSTASEIWLQLEKRFALSNGSRKYKLNMEIYDTKLSEESQREVFGNSISFGVEEKVGYPIWHYKFKQNQANNKPKGVGVKQGNESQSRRSAAAVESGHIVFTSKQFEQLMKNLPLFAQGDFKLPTNINDELDNDCVACISWHYFLSTSTLVIQGWILDTNATDHMTSITTDMLELKTLKFKPLITLPNGQTSLISQIRKVQLKNNILLNDVLVVPSFKFSLLSVPKLTQDNNCFVSFYPQFCVIQDLTTSKVSGLGKRKVGLYHLLNIPLH
ncbi:hypothetical protein Tco_0533498 [Tanacetum coccineum]